MPTKIESRALLSQSQLRKDVHAALRAWYTVGGTPQNLLESLLLVQERRRHSARDGSPTTLRLATNQVLLETIEELARYDAFRANVLRSRFLDQNTILAAANTYNVSVDHLNREQREAISQLTAILGGREMAMRNERAQAIEARLPPPMYQRLFGVEEAQERLLDQLLRTDAPWIIALTGAGGVGKTALADAVTRQVIPYFQFDEVIWIRVPVEDGFGSSPEIAFESIVTTLVEHFWSDSAEPRFTANHLGAVRRELKSRRCLVIIDNVETQSDTAYLLAQLANLAEPSKFLLTSREKPPAEVGVYTFTVTELPLSDATALLQEHLRALGSKTATEFTDMEEKKVLQVTGGNPMAIKVAAGLASIVPVAEIVRAFTQTSFQPTNLLYQQLYAATWQTMSMTARILLVSLLLVAESGALPAQMQAASGLTAGALWSAIAELASHSLLEIRGSAWEKRYAIHRLTESFLQTRIEFEERERFVDSVLANLAYWHERTNRLNDESVGALRPERANILRAVQVGMALPGAKSASKQLLSQAFPLIERLGEWSHWIPVFEGVQQADNPEDDRLQSRLINQLGILRRLNRDLQEAVGAHQVAAELARTAGDRQLEGEAQFHLGETYRHMRRYADAERVGLAAHKAFMAVGAETKWVAAALNTLGLVSYGRGSLTQAKERLTQAVQLWRTTEQRIELARSLNNLGLVLGDEHQYTDALQCYEEAGALLKGSVYGFDIAMVQISSGTIYHQMDRPAEAEEIFRQIDVGFLERAGHRYYHALAVQNLGIALLSQRKLVEAEPILDQSIALWHQVGDTMMLANVTGALAELKGYLGNYEASLTLFDEALELLKQYPNELFANRLQEDLRAQRQEIEERR